MIWEFLFWLCIFLILHSYLFFPLLIQILARKRHNNLLVYNQTDDLPSISILLSVYNEEKHIEKKIRNIFTTTYPFQKIEVIVGSDNSSDATNSILSKLEKEFPGLKVYYFGIRQGKAETLNQIYVHAINEILIFTDAKVLFSPQAIFQLVKHFKNNNIGIVGGNIVSSKYNLQGSALPEKTYMGREVRIKYYEGIIWRSTMGVYGACYAMRKNLFTRFPKDCITEDFHMNMAVLKQQKHAIMEINALCFEEVPNLLKEEFRRKTRISVGNFQNLAFFSYMISPVNPTGFCFFSHKVLRWFTPMLAILALVLNIYLTHPFNLYFYLIILQAIALSIPIFDYFLHKFRVDILILRFISHFYLMNIALIYGFIKYLKGVKTHVWEPTKR
jgi:cellulose synthase/poly-beta-1,6-N-acetylglucosamine synthase-like glycosyltransferase